MKLVVGLGNPGKEYANTRHNMGFDVVDKFVDSLGLVFDKKDFNGEYVKTRYFDEEVIVLKPLTYMNLSGDSLVALMNFYRIDVQDLIVVYDDMDTPVGHIKLKIKGSSGGHNGIKSIIQNLKTEEFKRIKIGIGHPTFNTIDFVLSKPSKEDRELIDEAIDNAVKAIKMALKENFDKAMNSFNK